jgi:glycosyltransferase involved in cell wall biosynthesis
VPTTYKESKGLSILEALANGVPVVQPSHGTFPEFISLTQGGVLVEPNSVSAIAEGILKLINDGHLRERLGSQGKTAVHQKFSDHVMAEATLEVYQKYLQTFNSAQLFETTSYDHTSSLNPTHTLTRF